MTLTAKISANKWAKLASGQEEYLHSSPGVEQGSMWRALVSALLEHLLCCPIVALTRFQQRQALYHREYPFLQKRVALFSRQGAAKVVAARLQQGYMPHWTMDRSCISMHGALMTVTESQRNRGISVTATVTSMP